MVSFFCGNLYVTNLENDIYRVSNVVCHIVLPFVVDDTSAEMIRMKFFFSFALISGQLFWISLIRGSFNLIILVWDANINKFNSKV